MIVSRYISTATSDGKRLNTVVCFGANNTNSMSAYDVAPFGFDSVGVQNMQCVFSDTSNNRYPIIVGWLNTNKVALEGESRMYSYKPDSTLCTYIWLHNAEGDGQIELGGTSNWAVKYNELATQFNELKGKLNDLVSTFNTHIHPTPSGLSSPTTTPATPSTADITQAKNNKIKTL